jgi:hypothetical protein
MPIKIWLLDGVRKPEGMQYEVDQCGNTRITSPLGPVFQKLAMEKIPKVNSDTDVWLAYIQEPTNKAIKKENKQRPASLTITTPSSQEEKKQTPKPTKISLQGARDPSHIKLQEKPIKKQAQKLKKPATSVASHSPSLEGSAVLTAVSSLGEKLVPAIPLQTTPGTVLSLLPTIEQEKGNNTDHPTVLPTTSTTQTISNNTSLILPAIAKEPIMANLIPTVEDPVLQPAKQPLSLLPASSPIEKKAPTKLIIVEKPAKINVQVASLGKEKIQQEAREKTQQKAPSKKIAAVSPENCTSIPQSDFLQNTMQTIPQHFFTIPQGLRSFHAQQLQAAAHPIILYPKHQATIDQLFDPATQCNITYKVFATLWIANGGYIKQKGGSHCTLQFPQEKNLFGIYKPHGSSTTYGKQAVRYLQAATLYIGLQPTKLKLINL